MLAALIFISSCAKRPDAISPTTIPVSAYQAFSCKELDRELNRERAELNDLSAAQNQAANADAVGVFLIGIPAGSVSGGDKEGKISVTKGKILSIESVQLSKKC